MKHESVRLADEIARTWRDGEGFPEERPSVLLERTFTELMARRWQGNTVWKPISDEYNAP